MKSFHKDYLSTPADRRRTAKELIRAIIFMMVLWPAAVMIGNLIIEGLK